MNVSAFKRLNAEEWVKVHICSFNPSDEAEANACLVSAAPDLLEACKLAYGAHNRDLVLDALIKAISKAEGRE